MSLIGLGPGASDLLTPRARSVLSQAAVVVGYSSYIQLLESELLQNKEVISTGMTKEVARCQAAIDRALSGRSTAVVCSGDSGIYALAGLILELLEHRQLVSELPLQIVPGVPALAAAAASLGAPLMHDFASISLSDLLTPWSVIAKRLQAAADADFVLVLYNPRSKSRPWQLQAAVDILTSVRPGSTPVGVVRNASRPEESVTLTSLDGLDPAQVDMKCTLIIGNSQTRQVGQWLLTPRGYAGKYDLTRAPA